MKRQLLPLIIGLVSATAMGQGISDVKINEILVKNADSYTDDYGHRESWIELYNAGHAQVNIESATLRFTQGGKTVDYRIPKGDSRTLIPPQGYVVFFCDATTNRGTFHTNFSLDEKDSTRREHLAGTKSRIELYDAKGENLVDALEFKYADQQPDISYGLILDDKKQLMLSHLSFTTPHQANDPTERITKDEIFRTQDPYGIAMTLTALPVVFLALILLYIVFKQLGKYNQKQAAKKQSPFIASTNNNIADIIDAETIAAITAALHILDKELSKQEASILTINRVAKVYSPWSSKFYSMQQMPNKK